MKFVSKFILFAIFLNLPDVTWAQLDASYELLLGNSVTPDTVQVIPKREKKKRQPASEEPVTNVQVSSTTVTPTPAPEEAPAAVRLEEPSISQQAKSLFAAHPEKVLGFYDDQFNDEDPRQNRIEISFAPSYVSNESSSNYSYRDYRSVFTGMNLGANVWLTPAIGLGGDFLFSLGADTSGDAVTNTRSPARYEYLDLGLKFRQFFGFQETSRSLEFAILFSDRKFSVAADDLQRLKLKSSGLGLKMTLRLPSSPHVSWLMGASFFPRLQHSEDPAGIEARSGNNTENVRFGVQLGSEIKLSRRSQIFYEASLSSEKNLFDGSATHLDPATGLTPTNVSVTDSIYGFSIGYRWGN